ncbi:hypothetical protein B0H10DRAFT_2442157, partial [Mycena sp. CBHHK59/15]
SIPALNPHLSPSWRHPCSPLRVITLPPPILPCSSLIFLHGSVSSSPHAPLFSSLSFSYSGAPRPRSTRRRAFPHSQHTAFRPPSGFDLPAAHPPRRTQADSPQLGSRSGSRARSIHNDARAVAAPLREGAHRTHDQYPALYDSPARRYSLHAVQNPTCASCASPPAPATRTRLIRPHTSPHHHRAPRRQLARRAPCS